MQRLSGYTRTFFYALLTLVMTFMSWPAAAQGDSRVISSLGRIEPAGGVLRLAGPSGIGAVLMELKVEAGDWVEEGQEIAILDTYAVRHADKVRLEAELDNAKKKLARERKLAKAVASSAAKVEDLELNVKAAQAALTAADAMLALSTVVAPRKGQILFVHSQPGERVGVEGVVEMGQTDTMYAVAEVYETDIIHVEEGQTAQIISPALPGPQSGKVDSIGLKVGRMDVLGMDPVAQADARVIEVHILLDDPAPVSHLTNLQVEVEITP
ncbi:MAG: HlyD family efflux transporter periplasmic adaptor subunit [Pseudomonadota bacterium]